MNDPDYTNGLTAVSPHFVTTIRAFLLLIACSVVSSCGNFMYKQEVQIHGDLVKKELVNCSSPHLLTRGCNDSKLAVIDVNLHGLEFKAAFSEDGSVILVMRETVTGGTTVLTNMIFEGVRTELANQGLLIQAVTGIQAQHYEGADVVLGYLLKVNGDGFSVLSPHFAESDSQ